MIDANARRCPVPRLASAAALLFALTSSPHADATIFTVGTDGACNRSTIAAAVADAEANPGPDTIRITVQPSVPGQGGATRYVFMAHATARAPLLRALP